MVPTLLIGLGGSGTDVLMRVRRLFFERYGLVNDDGTIGYPFVGYLALDTDNSAFGKAEDPNISDFVRRNIQLRVGSNPPEAIHCLVEEAAFNEYLRGGERDFSHIFSWLDKSVLTKYGALGLVGGAGQCRPLGRLAFFHHYARIEDTIRRRIEEIQRKSNPMAIQAWAQHGVRVDTSRLHVVMVYSLAGGTGAGMFLDAGILVRKLLTEMQVPGIQPYYTHFAILPDAFLDVQLGARENLNAVQENAFGALREMEYFSMRRIDAFGLTIPPPAVEAVRDAEPEPFYRVKWTRTGPVHDVHSAPWDLCYLVGSENDSAIGDRLPHDEVYQMIADHLFIDFDPSAIGDDKRRKLPNLVNSVQAMMPDEVRDPAGNHVYTRYLSRRFSSFGLSKIYFDRMRMRRAAGYRLAVRLINEWWLRDSKLNPARLSELALLDIGDSEGKALVVTETHLKGETLVEALSLDAIATRIIRGDDPERTDMSSVLVKDSKELAKRLEDEPELADGGSPTSLIDSLLKAHLDRLRNSESAGTGLVIQEFVSRRATLRSWIKLRIGHLFSYRVERHGIDGANALMGKYSELLRERVEAATTKLKISPRPTAAWQERIRDARRLPLRGLFPSLVRKATQIEMIRAVRVVTRYLEALYRFNASNEARTVLDDGRKLVTDNDPGSFRVMLVRFRQTLKSANVEGFLQGEFDKLNGTARGHEGQGGPAIEANRTKRSLGLFDKIRAEEYDLHILSALRQSGYADEDGVIAWTKLEAALFAKLRKTDRTRWREVQTLGDLVHQLFRPGGEAALANSAAPVVGPAPGHVGDSLAADVAEACEEILDLFVTETNALRVFYNNSQFDQAQRGAILDQFCRFSAFYLRRNHGVAAAAALNTPVNVSLGLAHADTNQGQSFVNDLNATQAAGLLGAALRTFEVKDDEIMLYQDIHGVPLCYYRGLDALARVYEQSTRFAEAHFDYNALVRTNLLPDITMVDQAQHRNMVFCIEQTILATITGRLSHDGNAFQVVMPQAGGVPLIFRVGGGIDQVARFCAKSETEHVRARQALARGVADWLAENAHREEGLLPVLLWVSLQYLQEELRERVQAQIDLDHRGLANPGAEVHPLLSVLANLMIPQAERRVLAGPRGQDWLNAARWAGANALYLTGPDRENSRALWWSRFVDFFQPVRAEMPIPVIRQDARLQPGSLARRLGTGPALALALALEFSPGLGKGELGLRGEYNRRLG